MHRSFISCIPWFEHSFGYAPLFLDLGVYPHNVLRGISLPLHRGAQPLAWRGISLILGGIFPYSEGNFCYSWGVSPSLNGIPLNPYLNGNSHLLWGGDSHSLSGASPLSDRHSSVTPLSALGEFSFTSEAPPPVLLGPFLFHSFLFSVGGRGSLHLGVGGWNSSILGRGHFWGRPPSHFPRCISNLC